MKRDSVFGRFNCRKRFPGGPKAVEPLVLWAWSRYPETFVNDGLLYLRVIQRALLFMGEVSSKNVFRDLSINLVNIPVPTMNEVSEAVTALKARGMTPDEWDEYRRDEDAGKPYLGPEEFSFKKPRSQRLRRGRTLTG